MKVLTKYFCLGVVLVMLSGAVLANHKLRYPKSSGSDDLLIATSNGFFDVSSDFKQINRWWSNSDYSSIVKAVYSAGLQQLVFMSTKDNVNIIYALNTQFAQKTSNSFQKDPINTLYQSNSAVYVASALGLDNQVARYDGNKWQNLIVPMRAVIDITGNNQSLYALNVDGRVSQSSDQGVSWSAPVVISPKQLNTASRLVSGTNGSLVAYGNLIGSNKQGVFYSKDGGGHWAMASVPSFGGYFVDMVALPGNNGFLILTSSDTLYSLDGEVWQDFPLDPTNSLRSIACSVANEACYIPSGNRIYIFALDTGTVVDYIDLPAYIGKVTAISSISAEAKSKMSGASIHLILDPAYNPSNDTFGLCRPSDPDPVCTQKSQYWPMKIGDSFCFYASVNRGSDKTDANYWQLQVAKPGIIHLNVAHDSNNPFIGEDLSSLNMLQNRVPAVTSYPNITNPYLNYEHPTKDDHTNIECNNPSFKDMDFEQDGGYVASLANLSSGGSTTYHPTGTTTGLRVHAGDLLYFDISGGANRCFSVNYPLDPNTRFHSWGTTQGPQFSTPGLTELGDNCPNP